MWGNNRVLILYTNLLADPLKLLMALPVGAEDIMTNLKIIAGGERGGPELYGGGTELEEGPRRYVQFARITQLGAGKQGTSIWKESTSPETHIHWQALLNFSSLDLQKDRKP